MTGFIPNNPNPMSVANFADRCCRQQAGWFGTVFQTVTVVLLTIMTGKMLLDMVNDHHRRHSNDHHSRSR